MPEHPRLRIITNNSGRVEVWLGETLMVGSDKIKLDIDVPNLHLHTTLNQDRDDASQNS